MFKLTKIHSHSPPPHGLGFKNGHLSKEVAMFTCSATAVGGMGTQGHSFAAS